jgi:hypothetical protein
MAIPLASKFLTLHTDHLPLFGAVVSTLPIQAVSEELRRRTPLQSEIKYPCRAYPVSACEVGFSSCGFWAYDEVWDDP